MNGRVFVVDRATEADVPGLVALLADDGLGAQRETDDLEPYLAAFRAIDRDPHNLLVALRDASTRELVGTMQLTLIPGLSRAGTTRLQIEGVRLSRTVRGTGVGRALFEWAHGHGRAQGATLAQLTSDRTRTDALRFYERIGYQATHQGFKRAL